MNGLKNQRGFSLVELAVVLFIIGIIMGGVMSMFKPYLQSTQRSSTQKKLETISTALAQFAIMYGRLPCPADPNPAVATPVVPFGSPRKSGIDGSDIAKNKCGTLNVDHIGIIPFRALGLTEEQARDGYNNFITYAVSPSMTKFDSTLDPPDTAIQPLGSACQMPGWTNSSYGNPFKSHVCCPLISGLPLDLVVLDAKSSLNSVYIPSLTPTQIIAYVLVSHGSNGDGAFLKTGNTLPKNTSTLAQENENYNNDLIFVQQPNSTVQNDSYFDDIVVFKTNDQLISQFGDNSCARP